MARLRSLLFDDRIRDRFRTDERAFTRTRKLPFPKVAVLMLTGWKMALQSRVNRFFHRLGQLGRRPTAAAFCQARKKVKPELFRRMNAEMVACLHEDYPDRVQRWRERLLWAVDATILNVPDTAETRARYSVQTNQHDDSGAVQALASLLYDVLNEVTINAELEGRQSEKRFVLTEHSSHFCPEAIVLYDRLYADYAVMAFHQRRGEDYVIRARSGQTFKAVEEFSRSAEREKIVTLSMTAKQRKWVEEHDLSGEIRVRLVKVWLEDGSVEVLMTSLLDRARYPAEAFAELYAKRWGIETHFDRLKNILEVERFSAQSVQGIEQDFHGLVLLSTLASVLLCEEEERVNEQSRARGLKYSYKLNRSVSYATMVDQMVELLLDERKSPAQAHQELLLQLQGVWIPIRPGRRPQRDKRTSSQKLRFQRYGRRIWS